MRKPRDRWGQINALKDEKERRPRQNPKFKPYEFKPRPGPIMEKDTYRMPISEYPAYVREYIQGVQKDAPEFAPAMRKVKMPSYWLNPYQDDARTDAFWRKYHRDLVMAVAQDARDAEGFRRELYTLPENLDGPLTQVMQASFLHPEYPTDGRVTDPVEE
jgi:hypothetical protein